MRKLRGYHLLYGASGLMVLGFCINLGIDYIRYNSTLNSAPFWLWVWVDGLLWLLPAALAFAAGAVAKKKLTKKEKKP